MDSSSCKRLPLSNPPQVFPGLFYFFLRGFHQDVRQKDDHVVAVLFLFYEINQRFPGFLLSRSFCRIFVRYRSLFLNVNFFSFFNRCPQLLWRYGCLRIWKINECLDDFTARREVSIIHSIFLGRLS